MKKLLRQLKSTRGEGYVDITVAVLIIMILLAGVIKIAPVFITKMTLNSYANELCREAEIAGRIGTETTARLDRLNESHPDLAPTVTWSASGNIQIGRTFSVTVSADYDFSFFRVQYHPDNHFSHGGGNKRGVLEMKCLKKRMLANSGFSYVITSVLMICVLLIGVAVFEVIRLYIQAGAVRDKFEDSIISMCVENYSEMYQPIRESHAASYRYNGFRWVNSSKANERYIRTYLSRAMNAGEIMQCEIVSVSFNVEPAALAPSDTDSAQKYAVSGTLVIRIPYRFAWQELPPIEMSLDVRSQWQAKF